MGLLEKELEELRKLNQQFMKGKVDSEYVQTRIAIYSQTEKRAKMMLQAMSLLAKYGKRPFSRLTKANLIGGEMPIDTSAGNPKFEDIFCPLLKERIIREQCLDISSKSENYDFCTQCDNYNVTRRLLFQLEEYKNQADD